MIGEPPLYVLAQYRSGHVDMTQVPNREAAYRVHRERYENDGAEVVKVSSGLPRLAYLPKDSVTFRPYEPHGLITHDRLPLPVRKGAKS